MVHETRGIFDGPPISTYLPPRGDNDGRRADNGASVRADIQGLRAVAVIAVVVNHLTGHPQGGFVGVDVFFVISGYLITGLLLREGDRTGTISWINFYKRRIRRLLPASLTVTIVTIIAAYFIFTAQRFHDSLLDGLWATGFLANWRLINTGTDYFQAQHARVPAPALLVAFSGGAVLHRLAVDPADRLHNLQEDVFRARNTRLEWPAQPQRSRSRWYRWQSHFTRVITTALWRTFPL